MEVFTGPGSQKYHHENLQRCCRICGEYSGSKVKQYFRECHKFAEKILVTFGVDVENDISDIYPTKMCNKCYIKCFKREVHHNLKVSKDVFIFKWFPHQDNSCDICKVFKTFQNGGRKRKNMKSRGRPAKKKQITKTSFDSLEEITNAIPKEIIPVATTSKMPALERFVLPPEELVCSVCKEVLDRPLECPCEHHFCYECIAEWIYNTGNSSSCPLCKNPVSVETLSKVPRLVLNLLCSLLVSCSSCKTPVRLDCLEKHEESCTKYLAQPCSTTVSEVLKTPCSAPLSSSEEILATHLMKRKMNNSTSSQIILKTGGTPLQLSVAKQARVGSSTASKKTLQRRALVLYNVRKNISGGSDEDMKAQHIRDIQIMKRSHREELIKLSGVKLSVPPGQGLAIKTELGIPIMQVPKKETNEEFPVVT